MKAQIKEQAELYASRNSPGESIPVSIDKYNVRGKTPWDSEIRKAVRSRLQNGKAGGASKMCAEDIKNGWEL